MASEQTDPYDDAPGQSEDAGGKPSPDSDEHDDSQSALLPKSFFDESDLKVGYKCQVEIVALHDEEVSVKYLGSQDDQKEEEPPQEPQAPQPQGDPQMSSMYE